MLSGIFGTAGGGTPMILHNMTTLLLSLNSMRPLMPGGKRGPGTKSPGEDAET
jgi:hypothetical protein